MDNELQYMYTDFSYEEALDKKTDKLLRRMIFFLLTEGVETHSLAVNVHVPVMQEHKYALESFLKVY